MMLARLLKLLVLRFLRDTLNIAVIIRPMTNLSQFSNLTSRTKTGASQHAMRLAISDLLVNSHIEK